MEKISGPCGSVIRRFNCRKSIILPSLTLRLWRISACLVYLAACLRGEGVGCYAGSVTPFYARSKNCTKRLLASSCLSFYLSVRSSFYLSFSVEKLGFRWTDFHEILHLNVFRKSVEMFQVSIKTDKNDGHLRWRRACICDISLHSSSNAKFFGQKL
jgi:hypothetical protein